MGRAGEVGAKRGGTWVAHALTTLITWLIVQGLVAHLGPRALGPLWVYASFSAIVALPLWFLVAGPVRWFLGALSGKPANTLWLGGAAFLATGMIATLVLATPVAPAARIADIVVEATGSKVPQALSTEVWFRIEVDGVALPPQSIPHDTAWSEKNGYLLSVPATQPASVHWRGDYRYAVNVVFVSHPWSGQARVRVDGKWRTVDLFAAKDTALSLNAIGSLPGDDALFVPDRSLLQRWIQLCDGLLIGLSLAMVFVWLVAPRATIPQASETGLAIESVYRALPTIVVSSILLGLYFPGLMSSDSADQWNQAGIGQFSDAHPILYGLMMRMTRKVADTPGLFAYLQMLGFALPAGALVAVMRRSLKAPAIAGTAAAWLLALHPMVSLTGVTLWKDVPYSAALVALTAFVMHALFNRRPDFHRPAALLSLVGIAFVCMAMRHNGPPVVLVSWALLWLIKREDRKPLAMGFLAVIALFAFYKGPLPSMLNATQSNAQYVIYSHHIAAHLANGHRPDPAANAILATIDSSPDWRYNCASGNPTLFDKNFNSAAASRHTGELRNIWLKLAIERPDIELQHYVCVTSLVWRASEEPRWLPLYLYSYAFMEYEGGVVGWVFDNGAGQRELSLFPGAAQTLARWILRMDWGLFVRPAAFLYLLFFAVMVAWARARDARVLVLLVIPTVHSAVLMVASVAQDARYQLPVYVIALATVPCLLAAGRVSSSTGPAAQKTESSE